MILSFTSATNRIRDAVNSSLDVLVTTTTNCGTAITSQTIAVANCDNVVIEDVSQDQTTSISQTCMTSSDTDQSASNAVEEEFKQAAEAITSGPSFADGTITKNDVDSVTALGTSITAAFVTNCPSAIADQEVTVADCKNATLRGIKQSQIATVVQNCTASYKAVQDGTNDVIKKFDQKAKSEQLGLFGGLAGIVALLVCGAIVVAVIKGASGGGSGRGTITKIVMAVCVGIIALSILFVVFYAKQYWPYSTLLATDEKYDEKKKKNNTILMISSGIGGLALLILIGTVFLTGKKTTPPQSPQSPQSSQSSQSPLSASAAPAAASGAALDL